MKKLLCMLFMAFAVLSFAQGDTKPEFQAFSSSLLKLKPAEGGWQKFSLKVEVAPWAFQAIGDVHIVAGDAELLNTALYDGTLYAVVAYIPAPAAGTDGKEYQVGVFDMMLFLEDEPTQVRNVKFRLLPPANDEWALGIFKDAIASGTQLIRQKVSGHTVEPGAHVAVVIVQGEDRPQKALLHHVLRLTAVAAHAVQIQINLSAVEFI